MGKGLIMQSKILKAQFNKMCLGGILLDMETVALFSGANGMSNIEVTPNGINIQPGPGKPLVISTMDIRGLGYRYQMCPTDFFPVAYISLPRKNIDLQVLDDIKEIITIGSAFGGVLGSL